MKRLALNQYPANARAIPNRVFRQPSYTRKSFQVKAARLPHTSSTHSEGSRASFSSEVPLQFPEAVNSGSFALTAAGGANAPASSSRKSLRIRPSVSGVQSFASSAPLRSMTATSVAPQSATQLPSLPAPQYLEPVAPRRRRNKRSSRNKRSRSKRSSSSRSKRSSRRQLV